MAKSFSVLMALALSTTTMAQQINIRNAAPAATIQTLIPSTSSILLPNQVSRENNTNIVDRYRQVNQPWGKIPGVLQFRGNPMRNFYGTAQPGKTNLPDTAPTVQWQYPQQGVLTGTSAIFATGSTQWTGTGWTGQPVIWQRPDNKKWEVIVGAFDKQVHFIDAITGLPTRKPFRVGDLVKGSVTLDPDGYPILYFGAVGDVLVKGGVADGFYRALALDREPVEEMWKMHANDMTPPGGYKYSRDWDGNSSIINDHLIIGAEIGWIMGWKLNRGYQNNRVTVRPEMVLQMSSEHPLVTSRAGHRDIGIESSCAADGTILYCANGQGRVMGIDLAKIDSNKQAKIVFDFWTGDDVDASPVVDEDGYLYIAAEHERLNPQTAAVGQLMKLDPRKVALTSNGTPDTFSLQPIVWNINSLRGSMQSSVGEDYKRLNEKGGIWGTPALDAKRKVLYVPTHKGELLAVDTNNGNILWRDYIGYMTWSSPNIIGDTLVVTQCTPSGGLRAYDISQPTTKKQLWSVKSPDGGCIESSAAIYNGQIVVGTRGGHIYSFGWK